VCFQKVPKFLQGFGVAPSLGRGGDAGAAGERKHRDGDVDVEKERERVMRDIDDDDDYGAPVIANLDEFESQLQDQAVRTSDDVLKSVLRAKVAAGGSKLHMLASDAITSDVSAGGAGSTGADHGDAELVLAARSSMDTGKRAKSNDATAVRVTQAASSSDAAAVPPGAGQHVFRKKAAGVSKLAPQDPGAGAGAGAGAAAASAATDQKKRKTLLTFDMDQED